MENINRNPFKFLDSYTKEDRDIFFGRETELEEIYRKFYKSKILLVYGKSGTGKSSIINCGLVSKIPPEDVLVIPVRCGKDPVNNLKSDLLKFTQQQVSEKESQTQHDNILNILDDIYLENFKPITLIFDQFEEIFILSTAEERQELVGVLLKIIKSKLRVNLIIIFREEYFASFSEFENDIPNLFENRVRVEKMKKSQALSVIVSPCKVCGIGLEKGLPEMVLEKIFSESATIELTWMQVLMDRLYKSALARNEENAEIKLSDLEDLGHIGDVLGSFLDEQLKLMPEGKIGEAILKTLVSSEGTKRQLTLKEIKDRLETLGYKLEPEEIKQIVQHFIRVRLLSDKDENDRYELKHDSIAAKIFERLTLTERELQEVRQFVENSYKSYLKTDHLLGKKELEYVIKHEDKLFLKGELEKFFNESKRLILYRKRIQRRVKVLAFVSLIILIYSFGYWAIKEKKEYNSNQNAISALLIKSDDPKGSLNKAIVTYQKHKSSLTTKALYESFYELWNKETIADSMGNSYSPYKLVFDFKPCQSEILFADYSLDGEYIYGYLADTSIIIWTQFGKQLYNYKVLDKPLLQLTMSPDNKYLSGFNADSIAYLFDISGNIILQTNIVYDWINPKRVVAFSPDGKLVCYSVPGNKIKIFTTDGAHFQELNDHTQAVTAIDISNNGHFMVSASKDSTIILYYYNHEKDLYDVYNTIQDHKDIVWSVDFANNDKYFISASEDSTIGIWDFAGKNIVTNDEAAKKALKFPKTKFSDAYFCNSDNFIVFKQLNLLDTNLGNIKWFPWDLIFSWEIYKESKIQTMDIKFSSSGFLYKNETGEIRLLSNELFKYYTFRENFNLFSVNNSYMFGIDSNLLKFYPLNEELIIQLVREKKIFGKLGKKIDLFENLQIDF